tara:strand:+ start:14881 stop:15780 length:900 start_codon:yes stop_codon:yes gene_type:complete
MKLKILSWNINFIHNNWVKRLNNINKILENEINNCDIIALQEATLPFSDALVNIHKFLENTNIKHFDCALVERNFLYKYIIENFPKYKKYIIGMFEYFMNKMLYLCVTIFSRYGEFLKNIYFKHPYIIILFCVLCPFIFLPSCYFFGMITILNNKINYSDVKSKYIGNRRIQYSIFNHNDKEFIFINIHLIPGGNKKSKERMLEIKKILKICKKYDNVIIAGDFNACVDSKEYKYLIKKGYRSAIKECCGEELNTFPSKDSVKCVDFIWIKGDIKAEEGCVFGGMEASDHKGIKVTLNV